MIYGRTNRPHIAPGIERIQSDQGTVCFSDVFEKIGHAVQSESTVSDEDAADEAIFRAFRFQKDLLTLRSAPAPLVRFDPEPRIAWHREAQELRDVYRGNSTKWQLMPSR
jgi:hypothetical protein